jgi:hypothetical protein
MKLGIAQVHRVGVLQALVRRQRRVHAAHDDRHPPGTILGGDLIGSPRGIDLDADGNEVGRLVERDGFDPVVVQHALDIRWCQAREYCEREWLHAPFVDVLAAFHAAQVGHDER